MVNEVDASGKDMELPPKAVIERCAKWQPPPLKYFQVHAGGLFRTSTTIGDKLAIGVIYAFGAKRFKVIREHQTAAAAAAEAAARAAGGGSTVE